MDKVPTFPAYQQGGERNEWNEFDEFADQKRKIIDGIAVAMLNVLVTEKTPRVIGHPDEDLQQRRNEWYGKTYSTLYQNKAFHMPLDVADKQARLEAKEALVREAGFESNLLYGMALLKYATQIDLDSNKPRDPVLACNINREKWLNWIFFVEKFGVGHNHDLKGFYTEYVVGGSCPLIDSPEYSAYIEIARDFIKNNPGSIDILGLSE